MADRQRATAVYLIDQFALRAGNEKGEDEADTAGCCSLKFEHVTLRPPDTVIFDFLGKDSIRFYSEVKVSKIWHILAPLVFCWLEGGRESRDLVTSQHSIATSSSGACSRELFSIPFGETGLTSEQQVDPQVFKNLKIFKRSPKGEGDDIFDRLTTSGLNKHLSNYMPGLTAKVFRTYNASWTMSNLLREMKSTGSKPCSMGASKLFNVSEIVR